MNFGSVAITAGKRDPLGANAECAFRSDGENIRFHAVEVVVWWRWQ